MIQGRITKRIPTAIAISFKLEPGQKVEINRGLGRNKVLICRGGVETIIDKNLIVNIKNKDLIKRHRTDAKIGGIHIYDLFYKTVNKKNH